MMDDGFGPLPTERDIERGFAQPVAVESAFSFLRRNRAAANRAEELGNYMLRMTSRHMLEVHPELLREFWFNDKLQNITGDMKQRKVGDYGAHARDFTRQVVVMNAVRIAEDARVALRRGNPYVNVNQAPAQLVVPDMTTSDLSVYSTNIVLANASYPEGDQAYLGSPLGVMGITPEFVEATDALLTAYSDQLGLPKP